MPFQTRDAGNGDAYYLTENKSVFDNAVKLKRRYGISLKEKRMTTVIRPRVVDCVD